MRRHIHICSCACAEKMAGPNSSGAMVGPLLEYSASCAGVNLSPALPQAEYEAQVLATQKTLPYTCDLPRGKPAQALQTHGARYWPSAAGALDPLVAERAPWTRWRRIAMRHLRGQRGLWSAVRHWSGLIWDSREGNRP